MKASVPFGKKGEDLMPAEERKIVIIGAGPAGLTAALECLRRGGGRMTGCACPPAC